MTEPDTDKAGIPWQPVVNAMYDGVQVERAENDSDWEFRTYASMGGKVGLSRTEIETALWYMERSGLIHEPKDGVMALTETGLQIAHDKSAREQQNTINRTIMLAAIVTALGPPLTNWPPEGRYFEWIPELANAVVLAGGLIMAGIVLLLLFKEFYQLEFKRFIRWVKRQIGGGV